MGLVKVRKRWSRGVVLMWICVFVFPILLESQVQVVDAKKGVKEIYYVVSRMEGNTVILESEDGEQIMVERSKLPRRMKEEDVLSYRNGKYRRNGKKTKERKNKIEAEMKYFFSLNS